jgi:hypothetical protein
MATAGVIGGLGDALVQYYERQKHSSSSSTDHDFFRTMRMVAYRVPQAPFLDAAWRSFDVAATRLALSGARGVAFKVALDQILLNPTMTVYFFMSQSILESVSFDAAWSRTKEGWWPTVCAGCQYYCVVHTGTFGFIPVKYRIAWASGAAIVWTAYMSHSNQLLILKEKERET